MSFQSKDNWTDDDTVFVDENSSVDRNVDNVKSTQDDDSTDDEVVEVDNEKQRVRLVEPVTYG